MSALYIITEITSIKLDFYKEGFSIRSMADVSDEAILNRATLSEIKRMYYSNEITREQAKKMASPILNRINKKAAEIAKKHNEKTYPVIDFVTAMRGSW